MKTLRIGLLGGPGSGKSTTAASIYTKCKNSQILAYYVQEYAREEIDSGWKMKSIAEQFRILKEQRKREDIIPERVQVMVTDSPTFLSFFYALWYCKNPKDDEAILTSLYEEFLQDSHRYDVIILLNRVKPYKKDGTRTQSVEESDIITKFLKGLMDIHKIPYIVLDGDEESTKEIMKIIYNEVN